MSDFGGKLGEDSAWMQIKRKVWLLLWGRGKDLRLEQKKKRNGGEQSRKG